LNSHPFHLVRRLTVAPFPSTAVDRWAVARIQQTVRSAPIRFVLWDGFELPSAAGPPIATIVFKCRSALFGWVWDPELNFGEDYVSGAVEILGDLVGLLEAIYRALGPISSRPWWLWQKSNDAQASRENVHHHYDLGNAFYRLWLDREMVYTCAYFASPDATLEDAQIAKMDLVCRKLGLRAGERVVEAGCGWGSLASARGAKGSPIGWSSSRTTIAPCEANTMCSYPSACSNTWACPITRRSAV